MASPTQMQIASTRDSPERFIDHSSSVAIDNISGSPEFVRGTGLELQRAQEMQNRLLLRRRQLVEFMDDCVRLRRWVLRGRLREVIADCLKQVGRTPVMHEEDALADSP